MNDCFFSLDDFLKAGALITLPGGKLLLGWGGVRRCSFQELSSNHSQFYFPDFFLTDRFPWHCYEKECVITLEEMKKIILSESLLPTRCQWSSLDLFSFKKIFDRLQECINKGSLEKGVPYAFINAHTQMTPSLLQAVLHSSCATLKSNNTFLYGFWEEGVGMLGITPEVLFSYDAKQPCRINTMALAGTAPLSVSPEDFLCLDKEAKEHELVVSGICHSLKEFGEVVVGSRGVIPLSHFSHLMTPIHLYLKESFNFETLVQCLHPTPALGAFPKEMGKKWLVECETALPRGRFGAPVGYKLKNSLLAACYVAIRNVQWDKNEMRIMAGCGVVKESDFEKESQEIHLKLDATRVSLGL